MCSSRSLIQASHSPIQASSLTIRSFSLSLFSHLFLPLGTLFSRVSLSPSVLPQHHFSVLFSTVDLRFCIVFFVFSHFSENLYCNLQLEHLFGVGVALRHCNLQLSDFIFPLTPLLLNQISTHTSGFSLLDSLEPLHPSPSQQQLRPWLP